jgi:polar amino acid transport system permease protein
VDLYTHGIWKKIVHIYVEIIRGTPLLVQLYILYYGLPKFLLPMGISISSYTAAYIGFILNSAAYQIEYLKGGFKAISYEQIEAAHSLGMSNWETVTTILLPQGLRFSIPALSNELIYLLKYTSLGFVIQAPELMTKAKELASTHARYMETYLIVAFVYVFFTFVLSKLTDVLDEKLRIPGFAPEKIR